MEELKEFLLSHWSVLIVIAINFCTLIISMFRKKVKVIDVMTGLLEVLPDYIKQAEATGLDGSHKYTQVFSKSINYLKSMTGKSFNDVTREYAQQIDVAIENILSTPTKKETVCVKD